MNSDIELLVKPLAEIASVLKRLSVNKLLGDIAKGINISATNSYDITNNGNVNTANIADVLTKSLLVDVEENGDTVKKSVFEICKDEIIQTIREALFVQQVQTAPGEDPVTVDVSILSLMLDDLRGALYTGTSPNIKGVAELLGEMKDVQDDIKESLNGTTAGGVADVLDDIKDELNGTGLHLESIDFGIGSIDTNVNDIKTALGDTNTTLGNIHTDTTSIDGKIQ